MDVALWRRGREERQRHPHPFNSPLPAGRGDNGKGLGLPCDKFTACGMREPRDSGADARGARQQRQGRRPGGKSNGKGVGLESPTYALVKNSA